LADPESVELIAQILQEDSISRLLMVFTSRELGGNINESLVAPSTSRVNLIHIPPLTITHVHDWLRLTLFPLARISGNELMELAAVIQSKTLGNPHHIREFLKVAELKGHIYMNRNDGGWAWSIDDLERGVSMAENVVEFMLERMRELPKDTVRLVQYASCLGDLFDYSSLSAVAGVSKSKVINLLWPAIKEGILVSSVKDGVQLRRNKHFSLESGEMPLVVSNTQMLSVSSTDFENLSVEQISQQPISLHSPLLQIEVKA
jgi:histidine kinase